MNKIKYQTIQAKGEQQTRTIAEWLALARQRDALLAALKDLVEWHMPFEPDNIADYSAATVHALKAIAEAEKK